MGPTYTESEAKEAIAASLSFAEALRRLGMCPSGGAHSILKKYVERWGISVEHFDARAANRAAFTRRAKPLAEILVEGSTYHRGHLKARLYAAGLKRPACEMCGQEDVWRGRPMSLILDHINGISNDHRLENLRILCPNCAATLPTHCGRNKPLRRTCGHCGVHFKPKRPNHHYCSSSCAGRAKAAPRPEARKVERPPVERLLCEIEELGYAGAGRKYGVSDNAVRKWLRAEGVEPPRRTWPNRRRGDAGVSRPAAARRRGRGPARPPPRSR